MDGGLIRQSGNGYISCTLAILPGVVVRAAHVQRTERTAAAAVVRVAGVRGPAVADGHLDEVLVPT